MSSTACGHNDELVTLGAMQILSPEEQARLNERIRTCPACRKRLQEYRALVAAMPRLMMPEMAPSRAITAKAPPQLNGKSPHISLPLTISNGWKAPETHNTPIPEPLSSSRLEYRPLSQRLSSMVSSLAAIVLLIGLVGGFWVLFLARSPGGATPLNPLETAQPTTPISNPCGSGVSGNQGPACGLVLLDSSTFPAQLVEADPTIGQVMAVLPPLPVGNATLASLSADHRTLALGIAPYQSSDPTFLQMVSLNPWSLGAKINMLLDQGASLQNLAIAPDGTGVYAVIVSSNASQAKLRYYSYDRGHNTLSARWTAPLPFAPGDANSFALSSDGKTAYLFSAKTTPPQVDTFQLEINGLSAPSVLPLPSIAPEGQIPDPNAVYNPNNPIPSVYQPAVIFAPALNKLYLIHADAKAPQSDVLVVIDLLRTKTLIDGNDIPITEAGAVLAAMNRSAQPQQATRPAKGQPYTGRSEQGTMSSDGRWIYLTGTTYAPASNEGGGQGTGMGVLRIDAQTGHVAGHWLKGNTYSTLTISPDGKTLYMFGDPYTGANNPNVSALLALDTQQGTSNPLSGFTSGSFIFVLR